MSRFKIWKEGIEAKEGDILLKLIPCGDCSRGGGVVLIAVDKMGNPIKRGNLLFFHDNCALEFARCVNKEIGFELDKDGEIFSDEPLIPYKPAEKENPIKDSFKNIGIAMIDRKIEELQNEKKKIQDL